MECCLHTPRCYDLMHVDGKRKPILHTCGRKNSPTNHQELVRKKNNLSLSFITTWKKKWIIICTHGVSYTAGNKHITHGSSRVIRERLNCTSISRGQKMQLIPQHTEAVFVQATPLNRLFGRIFRKQLIQKRQWTRRFWYSIGNGEGGFYLGVMSLLHDRWGGGS